MPTGGAASGVDAAAAAFVVSCQARCGASTKLSCFRSVTCWCNPFHGTHAEIFTCSLNIFIYINLDSGFCWCLKLFLIKSMDTGFKNQHPPRICSSSSGITSWWQNYSHFRWALSLSAAIRSRAQRGAVAPPRRHSTGEKDCLPCHCYRLKD